MHRHHLFALAGCAGLSAIALTDAVTLGVTGRYSVFADGPPLVVVASDLVHGLTYLALGLVLVRESARFAAANRAARGARRVLQVCLAAAAAVFLLVSPALTLTGVDPDDGSPGMVVFGLVGTATLALMLLSGLVLGLALLRTNPLGVGGRLLGLLLPVALITVVLGFTAPGWVHPAYLETTLNVGVALLGVAVGAGSREPAVSAVRS